MAKIQGTVLPAQAGGSAPAWNSRHLLIVQSHNAYPVVSFGIESRAAL